MNFYAGVFIDFYLLTFSENIFQGKPFRICLGHIFHILVFLAAPKAYSGK